MFAHSITATHNKLLHAGSLRWCEHIGLHCVLPSRIVQMDSEPDEHAGGSFLRVQASCAWVPAHCKDSS